MSASDLHVLKVESLRTWAASLRARVAAGDDPESDLVLAHLLEERARRLEAGEDDHSAVPLTADDDD